jgi:hypothetical protein
MKMQLRAPDFWTRGFFSEDLKGWDLPHLEQGVRQNRP